MNHLAQNVPLGITPFVVDYSCYIQHLWCQCTTIDPFDRIPWSGLNDATDSDSIAQNGGANAS